MQVSLWTSIGRSIAVVILLFGMLPALLLSQAPADANGRIEAARERLRNAGIPAALVDGKIAEGRAKGAPAERIAAAVEARTEVLIRAQEVIGQHPGVRDADLSVAADALQAGVSAAALRAVSETAPAGQRAVAIAVLAQLVQQGEPSDQAVQRVRIALSEGPDALRVLPAQARSRQPPLNLRRSLAEGAAEGARARTSRTPQARPPVGVPADQKAGARKPPEGSTQKQPDRKPPQRPRGKP